jgi:hypothetical protein
MSNTTYCEIARDNSGRFKEIVIHTDINTAIKLKGIINRELQLISEPYGKSENIEDSNIRIRRQKELSILLIQLQNVLERGNTVNLRSD